jgi:hypothetical protein
MRQTLALEPLGPLYEPTRYPDVKDPCVLHDGRTWHLFGTGCGLPTGLEILHCTAPSLDGPWRERAPSALHGVEHIAHHAAPGVIADGDRLHLFLQQEFNVLGGCVEHLVSDDGGRNFVRVDTALEPLEAEGEASVYDPDPAVIDGQRYLTYAAFSSVGQPDLYLARSTTGTWHGPWERLGCVLAHEQVEYHNQLGAEDYEWGLEGPQLVQLPDRRILLTAVCFLADEPRGHRQRVLLAVADDPAGPYDVLGPLLQPSGARGAGENGHGTAVVDGGDLRIVYQERAGDGRPWRIVSAVAPLSEVDEVAA